MAALIAAKKSVTALNERRKEMTGLWMACVTLFQLLQIASWAISIANNNYYRKALRRLELKYELCRRERKGCQGDGD